MLGIMQRMDLLFLDSELLPEPEICEASWLDRARSESESMSEIGDGDRDLVSCNSCPCFHCS